MDTEILAQVPFRVGPFLLRIDIHEEDRKVGLDLAAVGVSLQIILQGAQQDQKAQVEEVVAEEQQVAFGERLLDEGRDQSGVPGKVDQEIQVIVFGQHQRLRRADVPVQVVDDRSAG